MAKKKSTVKKQTELIAVEVPLELVKAMDTVGIINREEYIQFLIASSLLNYQKIFKDEETEKQIRKIKQDSDHENYLR
jgi:hypothetical protein